MSSLRSFLLEEAWAGTPTLGARAAARFGISRQAVHAHITRLIEEGLIEGSGRTRARIYRLPFLADHRIEVPLSEPFDEESIWLSHFARPLESLHANVLEISRFGLTECLRNAADHSGAATASLRVRRNALAVEISVTDRGEGLFRRLDAHDPLRAALDLVKGGKSSDPVARAGRGIGSVARVVDTFSVWSGHHRLRRENDSWSLTELEGRVPGTTVAMRIHVSSRRTLGDSLHRPRIEVPVRLALRGELSPTSRAAARRLLERLETAGELLLDFTGIPAVGPAFADEIFRVFRRENPGVSLARVGASAAVERALRAAEGSGARS
ncbi:MAG: STAS-like domain-containing protein [Planctomycetota bacterium]